MQSESTALRARAGTSYLSPEFMSGWECGAPAFMRAFSGTVGIDGDCSAALSSRSRGSPRGVPDVGSESPLRYGEAGATAARGRAGPELSRIG